ncbi:MAG: hypothetical protein AB8B87_20250 [Granulosicoccus sp.]
MFAPFGRLGCSLQMDIPDAPGMRDDAMFFDPCFNDVYDLAGRLIDRGVISSWMDNAKPVTPEQKIHPRMLIPSHYLKSDGVLALGMILKPFIQDIVLE